MRCASCGSPYWDTESSRKVDGETAAVESPPGATGTGKQGERRAPNKDAAEPAKNSSKDRTYEADPEAEPDFEGLP